MWFAVDAAGPGFRAWPVGGDGGAGAPVDAADLDALGLDAGSLVIDGAATASAHDCPVKIDDLSPVAEPGRAVLPVLRFGVAGGAVGVARLVGALELGKWRDAPARGRLVCQCGEDGRVAWAFAREGRIERLVLTPTGSTLADLLRRTAETGGADEDDDVAFERGLSIAEDARDMAGDLDRVLGEAASGRLQGGAVGANLAGVLVAHDAARGLGLGRLGAPAALVGTGLLANRYAIALGRFGVAVRRIDPVRALVAGCQAIGRPQDSDCVGNSSH